MIRFFKFSENFDLYCFKIFNMGFLVSALPSKTYGTPNNRIGSMMDHLNILKLNGLD